MSWQKKRSAKNGESGKRGGLKVIFLARAEPFLRLLYIYFRFIVMSCKKIAQLALEPLFSFFWAPTISFILGTHPLAHILFCDTRIWYAVCVLRPDRTCRKRTWPDFLDTEHRSWGPAFIRSLHRTCQLAPPLASCQLALSTLGPKY